MQRKNNSHHRSAKNTLCQCDNTISYLRQNAASQNVKWNLVLTKKQINKCVSNTHTRHMRGGGGRGSSNYMHHHCPGCRHFQEQHFHLLLYASIYSTQGVKYDVSIRLPNITLRSCDLDVWSPNSRSRLLHALFSETTCMNLHYKKPLQEGLLWDLGYEVNTKIT